MPKYSYQIQTNNKNLSEFIHGDYWLIGATSMDSQELNKRLKTHLKSEKIDEIAIKKTVSEFIEWYKKDYENKENEPCTIADYEIVSGVGIAKIDENSTASLFRLGSFNFYLASNPKTEINEAIITLKPNEKLIADPKKASVADKIKFDGELIDGSYNFPFAVIQPIIFQEPTPPRPSFLKYIFSAVFLIGLLALSWFNQGKIYSIFQGSNDSTEIVYPSIQSDTSNTVIDTPSTTVETLPDSKPEINSIDYGKNKLKEINDLMKDGKNLQAIQRLDSLEVYIKNLERSENDKELDELLKEIDLLKKTLSGETEF